MVYRRTFVGSQPNGFGAPPGVPVPDGFFGGGAVPAAFLGGVAVPDGFGSSPAGSVPFLGALGASPAAFGAGQPTQSKYCLAR